MAGVDFSIPATNGSAGHATTQTSLFLHVPSAPSTDLSIFDYNLGTPHYYRLRLRPDRHLVLEFSRTGYGSASADLGALPTATWTWISCGFSTASGLHVRGDVTPLGGATVTTSVLASSGSATGLTALECVFGVGVAVSNAIDGFPNDADGEWLMSRLVQDQIAANDAGGNPRPIPTVDFLPGDAYREYLAHDPLGAGTVLSDSGTGSLDMTEGPAGLTLASAGPPLVSGASAPAGHEGDIMVFIGGSWSTLAAGTPGQQIRVSSTGRPEWFTP